MNLGLLSETPFETVMEEIPDGCSYCDCTGVEKYSTEEDEREYDEQDIYEQDYGAEQSGRRPCHHCNGVGSVPGNGPLIKWKTRLKMGVTYEGGKGLSY